MAAGAPVIVVALVVISTVVLASIPFNSSAEILASVIAGMVML